MPGGLVVTRPLALQARRQRKLSRAPIMELVLINVRHLIGPGINGLARFEPHDISHALGAAEKFNGFGFLHPAMVNLLGNECQGDLSATDGKSAFIRGMKQATVSKKKTVVTNEPGTLSERLTAAIAGRMTRAGLASKVGVMRQTAYYWFNGKTKSIDSETALKVAKLLGVNQEWLQTGKGAMYAQPELNDDEAQLIGFFRRMNETDKGVFMKMARNLARDADGPGTKDDPFRGQRPNT